jgi:DNA replication licensing factor MCM7
MNGNNQNNLDFPQSKDNYEKCEDFLRNFIVGNTYRKYVDQMQEISDRQRIVLEISLDDIYEYKGDEEFVSHVKKETCRFIRFFETAADKMLPAASAQCRERDVFDILLLQREEQIGRDVDPATAPLNSGMPSGLLRRYEVCILPSASDKPKKIREIKATEIGTLVKIKGMVTRVSDVKPHISVCTYTCDFCGSEIFQEIIGATYTPLAKCPSQRCTDNKTTGKIQMQTRGSRFIKYQELRLQELPDQVPVGKWNVLLFYCWLFSYICIFYYLYVDFY